MPEPTSRIEIAAPAASDKEAAAIAAAISRFIADNTPATVVGEASRSPWLEAALIEGVSNQPLLPTNWNGAA